MKPCPECNSDDIWPEMGTSRPFGMVCHGCGFVGPRVSDEDPDDAIEAWENIARKEPQK
jgi:hypothetical protein